MIFLKKPEKVYHVFVKELHQGLKKNKLKMMLILSQIKLHKNLKYKEPNKAKEMMLCVPTVQKQNISFQFQFLFAGFTETISQFVK